MARKKSAASRKAANTRRSAAAAAKAAKPEKNRSRRVQLHEVSLEEDIKYRAPINYRGFQIIGWICIVISVPLALLAMATKSSPAMAEKVQGILSVLRPIGRLSLPFLLLYNFSRILNNSEGYRKQLLRNGAAALGIAAASILIIERYIIGTAQSAVIQSDEILPLFTNLFQNLKSEGFFAFNLFIDLFLCTLTMYFLNARPKRFFTGKKMILFRLCVLLPIAYEVGTLCLKILSASGRMVLPFWCFPLLPVKPPMTFVLFVFLAFHVKMREKRFCRNNRTHEEYLRFMKTNRNSFHFSVYLSIALVVCALADLLLTMVISIILGTSAGLENLSHAKEVAVRAAQVFLSVGIGRSIQLAYVAPIMLLYSYNREPKRKINGMIIPTVGIGLIVLIVLEGIHLGVGIYMKNPERKIDLHQLQEVIRQELTKLKK